MIFTRKATFGQRIDDIQKFEIAYDFAFLRNLEPHVK